MEGRRPSHIGLRFLELCVCVYHMLNAQNGKPGKVGEFDSGQGKVREIRKNQGKVREIVVDWCAATNAIVTK